MSLSVLTLMRPWWLLALFPLGLLLWRLRWAQVAEDGAWRQVVDAHLLPHLLVGGDGQSRGSLALLAGGLVLAILALAGPTLPPPAAAIEQRTRVLVVDLSPAMDTLNGDASRLERVKLKILDLLHALPAGQTALLVYADEPYLVVPPSADGESIARFVPDLAVDAMPVPGNHPERALAMAARVLARSGPGQRDVLWITAGVEGKLPPLPALAGLSLSILHVAAAESPALLAAAKNNGGSYLRMSTDDSDVRQLIATAWLGRVARSHSASHQGHEFGYWLLLPLLLLAPLAFRRGLLLFGGLFITSLLATPPAEAQSLSLAPLADYLAWRQLQSGNEQAAAVGFADPRWGAVARYRASQFDQADKLLVGLTDADSLYNRGNALARQGRLVDALSVYDAALQLREQDPDIRYNRDLVRRLLDQQGRQPQGGGGAPPMAPPPKAPADLEAARLADQWLRRVPDQPGSLLRRKLLLEHRHRRANPAEQPW